MAMRELAGLRRAPCPRCGGYQYLDDDPDYAGIDYKCLMCGRITTTYHRERKGGITRLVPAPAALPHSALLDKHRYPRGV